MIFFKKAFKRFIGIVYKHITETEEQEKVIAAVSKILNFEQQIVLEAYEEENRIGREAQYEEVKLELKDKNLQISEELVALSEETNASVQSLISK